METLQRLGLGRVETGLGCSVETGLTAGSGRIETVLRLLRDGSQSVWRLC
jgi:hypothetical protein